MIIDTCARMCVGICVHVCMYMCMTHSKEHNLITNVRTDHSIGMKYTVGDLKYLRFFLRHYQLKKEIIRNRKKFKTYSNILKYFLIISFWPTLFLIWHIKCVLVNVATCKENKLRSISLK